MTMIFSYLSMILSGYLLGCCNLALLLSRRKGIDLRAGGTGNLGASNAMIRMGWKAGIAVGAHDIGKAFLSVLAARLLFPELPLIGACAGVACVLGHMFPFYLKFKGGKGFAAYLGMTLALNWRLALVIMAIVVLVTLITDYIVVGTVATVLSVPAYLGWTGRSLPLFAVLFLASAVILWKHRENYIRIWKGTEIGLRRANRGDDRAVKR